MSATFRSGSLPNLDSNVLNRLLIACNTGGEKVKLSHDELFLTDL